MRKTRSLLVLCALLVMLLAAGHAYADTLDLTWTGAYGPGNATLTATNDGGGEYTVTGITGTQNGASITGLVNYADADDLVFLSSAYYFNLAGISFAAAGTDYNLFTYTLPSLTNTYTECSSAVTACDTYPLDDEGLPIDTLSITKVSTGVPEPGSLFQLCAGLLVLGILVQRSR
jgi:hypothetical protein